MIDPYDNRRTSHENLPTLLAIIPFNIKRGLMLMSKILQNIANHVELSKE